MASGADTHTHIHPHRSDFKKPGARRLGRCAPGLKTAHANQVGTHNNVKENENHM